MSDFDDRELGDALRRRAGAATDGDGLEAARSKVVARAGRIRRTRVAIAGGAAMAGLVAAAAFVIGPGPDSVVTTPADRTVGSAPASVDRSLPTSAATEPDRTSPDDSTADTAPPVTALPSPTTLPAVVPSTVPPAVTAPPATTSLPDPPGTTVGTPATDPPTSPPTTTSPPDPPSTETYSSPGGSITVRWDGAALSLLQVEPGSGFTPDVEDELADRIRVRFEGDGGDFRVEIRVEDGEVVRVE